jgi:hypothetical protein
MPETFWTFWSSAWTSFLASKPLDQLIVVLTVVPVAVAVMLWLRRRYRRLLLAETERVAAFLERNSVLVNEVASLRSDVAALEREIPRYGIGV